MPDKVDFNYTLNSIVFQENRPTCPQCEGLQKMAWLEGTYYCLQCGLEIVDCRIACTCYWFQSGGWVSGQELAGQPGVYVPYRIA